MIKQTFYNLPITKRERIYQAIKTEFDRVPLDKISINSIIKEANISRGSFYQYFDDKGDLYDIFADKIMDSIKECFTNTLVKYKGDLFATTEEVMSLHFIKVSQPKAKSQMQKFVPGVSVNAKSILDRICERSITYFNELTPNIDTRKFSFDNSPEDIRILFEMLLSISKNAIFDVLFMDIDTDEAIKIFNKKLKIVKNGCLKKEYRED
nr:TetR/AcrR family transcriptional regulator [uncultured Ruminococcus sp.]